jgi:predicted PurR-regulated permease PerM
LVNDFTPDSGEERFPRVVHGPNRFSRLSIWLRRAVLLVALLAALTLLLPVAAAEKLGAVLVCLLIALPLARVLWFVQRWVRRRDLRFAAVGAGVLLVVGIGALLA